MRPGMFMNENRIAFIRRMLTRREADLLLPQAGSWKPEKILLTFI